MTCHESDIACRNDLEDEPVYSIKSRSPDLSGFFTGKESISH